MHRQSREDSKSLASGAHALVASTFIKIHFAMKNVASCKIKINVCVGDQETKKVVAQDPTLWATLMPIKRSRRAARKNPELSAKKYFFLTISHSAI
jgi:hypothetical protein